MQINYESVPYRPDESVAYFEFKGSKIVCPYHHHPEYEIAWIVRSSGRMLVGDALGTFQTGDLFLLGPGLPHIFWNDDDTRRAHTIVLQFKRDAFGEKLFDAPELRAINQLLNSADRGLHWQLGKQARLRRLLRGFKTQQDADRIIRFLEILIALLRQPAPAALSSIAYGQNLQAPDSARMQTVTQYVRNHLTEPLSQTEAARLTSMSAASFRRFFQRTTHRTFPRFVNELRISEACRLLVTTDLTVTEILYRCGYGNQANFYRRFRQILSTTPENYRRSLQNSTALTRRSRHQKVEGGKVE